MKKCPFRLFGLGDCRRDCALCVKTSVFDSEKNYLIEGFTCALTTRLCAIPNAQFVPAFVSETKCTKAEDIDG